MRTGGLLPAVALLALLAVLAPVSGQNPPDLCYLPPDAGSCYGYFPRYFYNPASKKCERFIYGGCDGNKNNFKTLKECRQTCIEKPGTCPSPWPGVARLCDVRCHSDWECSGHKKCCPYGCHVSCYDPI